MYRRDRINERDVPESQHTIFIRGLPGTMTTEDIRGFFANDGSCSFDFVKVSPDRTKLYVAVRFDSKNSAREVMEKYGKDGRGEILGHDVEMSWFRDIRRYLAHCAKQGIAPSRFNNSGGAGGGRRDFRDGGTFRPRGRRSRSVSPLRTRARSHSSQQNSPHSQSRSRSNSMSPDHDGTGRDNRSASRSRSPRSRSQSGQPVKVRHSRSRSKSASSAASSAHSERRNKSADYNDKKAERTPTPPPKRNKQKKKERKAERKRRRHHQPSPSLSPVRSEEGGGRNESDMEASEGELVPSPKSNKNGKPLSMMMTSSKGIGPNKPPEAFYQQQMLQKQQNTAVAAAQSQQPQLQSAPKAYTLRHIPDGSVAASQQMNNVNNEVAMLAAAAVTNNNQQIQQQPDSSSGYGTGIGGGQQNNGNKFRQTLFTVDLDNSSNVPKFKQLSDTSAQSIISSYSTNNGGIKANEDMLVKRPRLDSSPSQPSSAAAIRNSAPLASSSPIRESGPLAGSVFKDIQRQILQDVRYKPQPDVEEENLGGLRLSALSRQRMTDDMREEKVAKLSPEMRDRVAKKKRQLELSYRHDCETFGLVTRKLIEKDRTLEDRLKLALLDTMKDLEGETLKQLDEFLDQLSFIY